MKKPLPLCGAYPIVGYCGSFLINYFRQKTKPLLNLRPRPDAKRCADASRSLLSVASARMPSGEAETPRPQGSEKARRKLSNPARIESPAERAELFEDPGFTPKARPTPAAAPISTAPTEQNVATCSQEGDGDISAEVGAVEMLDNVLGPQADLSPETAAQKPPTQEGSPPPVSARRVLSLYGEWERDEYVVLNDNQRRAAFLRGGAVPVVGLTQARGPHSLH